MSGVVFNGRLFDPKKCVHAEDMEDYSGDWQGKHYCVQDWRCHWGNLPKEAGA